MTQPTRFVPVALLIPSFEGMTKRLLNSLTVRRDIGDKAGVSL